MVHHHVDGLREVQQAPSTSEEQLAELGEKTAQVIGRHRQQIAQRVAETQLDMNHELPQPCGAASSEDRGEGAVKT